ncbi:Uma2 family endonuclease [Streptacidiphilus anmyonensis]|uniref:Uma2 family endonuclease n=1 Tax=Streptacidiphilus anmyonensis TaxID=405782 RepID=UPI000A7E45A8|nr:Uma2 family endonuclease [Streptacidiphilus anmyonensis]
MSIDPKHLEMFEEVRRQIPSDWKVEFSGDTIVMQASPTDIHQRNLAVIQRQFERFAPEGYLFSNNTDLYSPQVAKLRNPDLTYLPDNAMTTGRSTTPAELALIAVEVVSPTSPENDWTGKLRDYPVMGIPLYLIVDARQKTVTLFQEIDGGRYRMREDADFGQTIHVPAPFDFALDTGRLISY